MANASHKHFGAGSQGKRDGSGANSDIEPEKIGENMVLSNRDKSLHTDARGLDSKTIQTEQLHDHPANRIKDD